jgi:hypothetical protein
MILMTHMLKQCFCCKPERLPCWANFLCSEMYSCMPMRLFYAMGQVSYQPKYHVGGMESKGTGPNCPLS